LIRLVLAGIRHRALRSATSILVMATSMAVLTLTAAGLRRADAMSSHTPDFLAVASANLWLELPVAFVDRAARLPGVKEVDYFDTQFALDSPDKQRSIGSLIDASDGYFRMSAPGMIRVDPELEERWRAERQGLIANPTIASKMGWQEGQLINLTWQSVATGEIKTSPFKYLGTYQGAEPSNLVAHYDYVDQLLDPSARGQIFLMGIFQEGASDKPDTPVRQLLKELPDPAKMGPSRQWMSGIVAGELSMTELLEKLTLGLLFITCAIVGATVAMSLRERRAELGTLRALGFSRSRVLFIVILESGVLALVGYCLGVLLPTGVLVWMHQGIDLGPSFLADVRPGGEELVLAAAAAALLTLGISIWPALAASRQDVVAALQEG
jgi:putative ABC transport system permease protein